MTNEERQKLLEQARLAARRLNGYKFSINEVLNFQQRTAPDLGFFYYSLQELMAFLLVGFDILDAKEQKQIKAGKKYGKLGASHGKKGGRPRKTDLGKLAEWDSSAGEVGNPVIFNPDILKTEDKR